jgi:transcriptional regulator with XRE-family HTH domain
MDLGHRIRDLRNDRRLSQTELAAQASIARNTLNRIENGHLMPTAPVIERLAEGLGVAPGALFEEPVPLDEAPQESGPPDLDPGVRKWLEEQGARFALITDEEFHERVAEIVEPAALDKLEEQIIAERQHVEQQLDRRDVRKALFPPGDIRGLATRQERVGAVLRPESEAWQLRWKLGHEYTVKLRALEYYRAWLQAHHMPGDAHRRLEEARRAHREALVGA